MYTAENTLMLLISLYLPLYNFCSANSKNQLLFLPLQFLAHTFP